MARRKIIGRDKNSFIIDATVKMRSNYWGWQLRVWSLKVMQRAAIIGTDASVYIERESRKLLEVVERENKDIQENGVPIFERPGTTTRED